MTNRPNRKTCKCLRVFMRGGRSEPRFFHRSNFLPTRLYPPSSSFPMRDPSVSKRHQSSSHRPATLRRPCPHAPRQRPGPRRRPNSSPALTAIITTTACRPAIYPALLRLRTPARSYHRREVVQVTTNRPSSMTSRGPRGSMNSPTSYGNTVPALSCTNPICSCATTTDNGVTHRDMKPENLWARDRRVECWRHPAHPSLRIPPFWGGECCSFFSFHSHSPFSNQDSGVLNY
jgi:hypothetical protein